MPRPLVFLAAAMLALAGCVSFLPLPLSPVAIIAKQFPEDVIGPGSSSRAYTIKGNVFEYPSVGFALTRPGVEDWEFVPGNSAVTAQLRNNLGGTEPRPALRVQLLSLSQGASLASQQLKDWEDLQKKRSRVFSNSPRVIDGMLGDVWEIQVTDPQSGIVSTQMRVYVASPQILSLIDAYAERSSYRSAAAIFRGMLASIKLPKPAQGEAALGTYAQFSPQGVSPDGNSYSQNGLTLTRADANWRFGLSTHMSIQLHRGGLSQGLEPPPQLGLLVLPGEGLDLAAAIEGERKAFEGEGLEPVLSTRVLGGLKLQLMSFDRPDVLGEPLAVQRLYAKTAKAVVVLESTVLKTQQAKVQPEFDKMIEGVKLPEGAVDTAATGAATASGAATPALPASGAASPRPTATPGK